MIQAENIPQELKDKSRWVCWKYEERDGKKTKVPYNARNGKMADVTNWKDHSAFGVACISFGIFIPGYPEARKSKNNYDGIGFVFDKAGLPGPDFIGIDLDNAVELETGTFKCWAREIIDQCATYAEISPSGAGVHLISKGALPEGFKGRKRNHQDGGVEIYDRGRYFTVTGNHIPTSPAEITDQSAYILELYKKLGGNNGNGTGKKNHIVRSSGVIPDDHGQRLEAALRDPVFSRLWHGDISANNNDDSAADLALCNKIVFYFGSDVSTVDSIFRQSALMRDKWEREDYRQWTITKAIEGTSESYESKPKRPAAWKIRHTTSRPKPPNAPISNPDAKKSETQHANTEPDLDSNQKTILANLNNAVRIIEHDPGFCDVWFDEFLQRILTGDPPREWCDSDDVHLTLRFQREKRISQMGLDTVRSAVTEIAFRRKKNCVKDWLESRVWDQVPRINNFFEDYYGTPKTEYTTDASKNFLIAMVARIYKPGCQVDNMIVLEGPQGILKSSSLRALAGQYHAEQHENVTQKDFLQNLQGKWLIEISEMDAFGKAETSKVKAVITVVSDHFRPSYGRRSVDHPRQCVFVGTTNRDDWNKDETGARRFWPIACESIDIDGIRSNRDQLFAEAVHRFKKGEHWWEMPGDETQKQQADRYVAPAWVEPIEKYIHHERVRDDNHDGFRWIPRAEFLTELSIAEVLEHALDVPRSQWSKANEMRVAESLRFMGWSKKDVKRDGKTVKRWALVAT